MLISKNLIFHLFPPPCPVCRLFPVSEIFSVTYGTLVTYGTSHISSSLQAIKTSRGKWFSCQKNSSTEIYLGKGPLVPNITMHRKINKTIAVTYGTLVLSHTQLANFNQSRSSINNVIPEIVFVHELGMLR